MHDSQLTAPRTLRTRSLLAGLLLITILCQNEASARPARVNRIPNGTVFSCANCHVNPGGGGTRTAFGAAVFDKIGGNPGDVAFWDSTLAGQDSDGDGFSNGQELGDPDGDFLNVGSASLVTNPGDASSKPNRAPSFNSSPGTSGTEGVLYSYQASATDPESNPLTFSMVTGPAWLGVSAAGAVSGTPPAGVAGSHAVIIRVTDNGSPALTADQNFTQ